MSSHFASRWGIRADLYAEAIEKQKSYLKQILGISDTDPRDYLRREGIVDKVRKKYSEK